MALRAVGQLVFSGLFFAIRGASEFCRSLGWLLNSVSSDLGFCFEMGEFPPLVALKEVLKALGQQLVTSWKLAGS